MTIPTRSRDAALSLPTFVCLQSKDSRRQSCQRLRNNVYWFCFWITSASIVMAEQPFSPKPDAPETASVPPTVVPVDAARQRVAHITEKLRAGQTSELLLARAAAYQDLSEFAKAEDDANAAIELSDSASAALAVRAECRLLRNQWKEAEADYAKSLATYPQGETEIRILVGYAILRHGQCRFIEAVRHLNRATMINRTKTADCYAALSAKWIQLHLEDTSGDIIEMTRDTLQTPRDPRVYQERIAVNYVAPFGQEALSLLDATMAAQLDCSDPWPLVSRAALWSDCGYSADEKESRDPCKEQSILDYDHALALRPSSRYIRQERCDQWTGTGRYDRALLCAEEMLTETPSQENLLRAAAEWRKRLQLPEKHYGDRSEQWPPSLVPEKSARQAFEAACVAVRAKPGDAHALLDRAEAQCELGEYDEAWKDCVKAVELQPDLTKGRLLWGELGLLRWTEPREKCDAAFGKVLANRLADKSDRVRALVGRAILRYLASEESETLKSVDDLRSAAEIDVALTASCYARLSGHATVASCRLWERAELARDIRQSPLDVSGYFMRVKHCDTGSFYWEAFSLLDSTMAVHLAPKDPQTWSTRARLWKGLADDSEGALVQKGWERAARDWGKVVELRPQWRQARLERVRALENSGDLKKAREEVEQLLRATPNDEHLLDIRDALIEENK